MGSGIYLANQMVESLLMAQNPRIAPCLRTSGVEGKADILGKFDAECPLSG